MFAALTQTGIGTDAAYAAGAGLLLVAILAGWNRALRKRIVQRTAALEESDQRFREMLENIQLIGVTLDCEARVTFCNDYLLELTGWRREEVIGGDWFVKFIPETSPEVEALFLDHIAAGRIPLHHENPIKTRSGERRQIRWNNTLLRDAAGRVSGTASIGEDVTNQNRAEMASLQLAAIVESSDDAIIGKDLHSIITSWNHGAENIFGYSSREMVGSSILRLSPTDRPEERKHVVERIRAGERVEHFETVRQTRDGRLIDISVAPSPIKDAAGAIIGVSIVARDITERKRVEMELRTAREQLRALVGRMHTVREEEAKRIARELHDDLGQQLTALNLKLAHLGMTLPDATPLQRDKLARMQVIVDHTIEVVQKIAGELRLGQLDVFGLTAAIEWHLQEFSRRSAISCRILRLDEVAHLTDEQNTVVFRILQEALTNVVRHAHATEVEISLRAEAAELTLMVRDNGRGITPAELNDHKAIGLLGMGERAALVGGDVTVTGEAGGGTTVLVRIPLNRPEAVAA